MLPVQTTWLAAESLKQGLDNIQFTSIIRTAEGMLK